MIGLSRWCIAHRRWVVLGWIAIAVGTTVIAGAVGRQYANNFGLPGTEAQRVSDLLGREFKAQSGDVDTIVFHSSRAPVDAPAVRSAIAPLLARVRTMPHVVSVISPYSAAGRRPGLPRPPDRVRDDQLRQAGEPAARTTPASPS